MTANNLPRLFVGLYALLHMTCATSADRKIFDPIFGVPYDFVKANFERAPRNVYELCRINAKKLWVFGSASSQGSEYYIVSGLYFSSGDGGGKTIESGVAGEVVEIHGNSCVAVSAEIVLWKLPQRSKIDKHLVLSDQVLENLASDVVRRYSQAFAGKENFVRLLKDNKVKLNSLPPIIEGKIKFIMNDQ